MKIYHWYNIRTGEVVENIWDVIETWIADLRHYHFIGVWKYSRKGF